MGPGAIQGMGPGAAGSETWLVGDHRPNPTHQLRPLLAPEEELLSIQLYNYQSQSK
jgi:hypothetical protein